MPRAAALVKYYCMIRTYVHYFCNTVFPTSVRETRVIVFIFHSIEAGLSQLFSYSYTYFNDNLAGP